MLLLFYIYLQSKVKKETIESLKTIYKMVNLQNDNIEDGDLYAFKRYYEVNASSLTFFARRFVSQAVAEDIVHDVFLDVYENLKSFDKMPSRSYLFMAVRNRCLNTLVREEVKENYIHTTLIENQLLGLDYYDSFENLLIEKDGLHELYEQIEQLPDKCRQIFKLAYFEEKKNAEIAELLDLSIRTVEHQLYLGLKTLRNKMTAPQKRSNKFFFFFF